MVVALRSHPEVVGLGQSRGRPIGTAPLQAEHESCPVVIDHDFVRKIDGPTGGVCSPRLRLQTCHVTTQPQRSLPSLARLPIALHLDLDHRQSAQSAQSASKTRWPDDGSRWWCISVRYAARYVEATDLLVPIHRFLNVLPGSGALEKLMSAPFMIIALETHLGNCTGKPLGIGGHTRTRTWQKPVPALTGTGFWRVQQAQTRTHTCTCAGFTCGYHRWCVAYDRSRRKWGQSQDGDLLTRSFLPPLVPPLFLLTSFSFPSFLVLASSHEVGAAGGILDGGGCCCGKGAASDGGGGAGIEERVNGGGGCWLRASVDVLSGVRTGAGRIGMGGAVSAAECEDAGGGVLAVPVPVTRAGYLYPCRSLDSPNPCTKYQHALLMVTGMCRLCPAPKTHQIPAPGTDVLC
ncbi:uncharacterized protein F5147DRAFT_812513 [Suillus discolor]|uniref:Uncharacterized protein n=1 Tax=Suillus discolor TaxID=1912936 RepID=A0A9P7F286_9AGAM|nr:uncharacterized protein F5147DRAFT_812513 [Suillus discolor]KAG2101067.1 hypothetical protein F5147DRAFT_812513 [Suillus discolor]